MKQWKEQEKLVRDLEATIHPHATVTNPKKKIKDRYGNKRQIDVLIEPPGHELRKQNSIVEVQRQKRNVGIGEFTNWVLKKENGGYGTLIGVSSKGFTEEVITYVTQDHPFGDVRLGILEEISTLPEWLDLNFNVMCEYSKINVASNIVFITPASTTSPLAIRNYPFDVLKNLNDFSFANVKKKCSIIEILKNFAHEKFRGQVTVKISDPRINYYVNNQCIDVQEISFFADVTKTQKNLEMEFFQYREIFPTETVIGYVILARGFPTTDNIKASLPIVFVKDDENEKNQIKIYGIIGDSIDSATVEGNVHFGEDGTKLKSLILKSNRFLDVEKSSKYKDCEIELTATKKNQNFHMIYSFKSTPVL